MDENTQPTVRLRTGAEVPEAAMKTTMLSLKQLASSQDMLSVLALAEVRALADDPGHALWPSTTAILEKAGLIEDGRLHDFTRDIVLAMVEPAFRPSC